MSLCSNVRQFSRKHEIIAGLSSLLAVALLFGAIGGVIYFQAVIFDWITDNPVIHMPLVVLAIVLLGFTVLGLLAVGSARFGEEDERCFGTFKGRRAGSGTPWDALRNWLHHMEHVGKKHR